MTATLLLIRPQTCSQLKLNDGKLYKIIFSSQEGTWNSTNTHLRIKNRKEARTTVNEAKIKLAVDWSNE